MSDDVPITGAGRGIGREVAVRLGAAGHRLGVTARTGAELSTTSRTAASSTSATTSTTCAPVSTADRTAED